MKQPKFKLWIILLVSSFVITVVASLIGAALFSRDFIESVGSLDDFAQEWEIEDFDTWDDEEFWGALEDEFNIEIDTSDATAEIKIKN